MKLKLHWQILISILVAIPFGLLFGKHGLEIGPFTIAPLADLSSIFVFLGKLFTNALKMIIIPLIASAIITSIANIGNDGNFARLGLKTLLYYFASSFLAIGVGLLVVNLMSPGIVDGVPAKNLLGLAPLDAHLQSHVVGKSGSDLWDIFLRMVPPNIIHAAANGQMLGIITFSLVFGFFMVRINSQYSETLSNFWNGVYEVMMRFTNLIMKFAPIGVFGLIANAIASTGFASFKPLAFFFLTVLLALGIHMFVTMPILLFTVGKVSPLKHFKAMAPAIMTAFSTSSSAATLPQTLVCVQNRVGVSKRTSGFVLPLGSTVNMDGTALYECVAAMFIAQAYGLEMSLGIQFTIVTVALLTSIGVAGIPSASLVAIVLILTSIGLPTEAIGLILVVDRVLDMCRTSVNVFGDSCGAVIIGKLEKEENILR
jgi:Na+/H+-dicarboxylate symporter